MRIASSYPAPTGPDDWARPPSALVAERLNLPPSGARVTVAGLVILRQRPGTAKGVIFLTLEDETGVVNVVVWRKLYEQYRRAVISGRLLRVTGRVQRDNGVVHVLAELIEDISTMLDELLIPAEG
jgi:DNA-directed RNA polymerase